MHKAIAPIEKGANGDAVICACCGAPQLIFAGGGKFGRCTNCNAKVEIDWARRMAIFDKGKESDER